MNHWCAIWYVSHIPCPGCGLLSSLFSLVCGNIRESFSFHPLGVIVVAWCGWIVVKKCFRIQKVFPQTELFIQKSFVILLFVQWIIRLVEGDFS